MQTIDPPGSDLARSQERRRRSGIGLTLAILGALWLAFLLFDLARAAETWGWQPVSARIVVLQTGTTRDLVYSRHAKTYKDVPHQFVVYQYAVHGQPYEGRQIGEGRPGQVLTAHYDPEAPGRSTLDQPKPAWIAGGMVLAVALIIYGSTTYGSTRRGGAGHDHKR